VDHDVAHGEPRLEPQVGLVGLAHLVGEAAAASGR
jgi:hypothetical protein